MYQTTGNICLQELHILKNRNLFKNFRRMNYIDQEYLIRLFKHFRKRKIKKPAASKDCNFPRF